jgi:excisionase family DNA binding protein
MGDTRDLELWGIEQAAEALSLTVPALRQAVHRRQIPFVRLGEKRVRFDPQQLQAWLRRRSVLPEPEKRG